MFTSLALFILAATAAEPVQQGEFIFPPNDKHNHGSSIVETPDGDLIAAWFHGTGERQSDDVIIQGARKRKGETNWSEPFLMADTPDLPDCNPVLFMDPRGVLWLFWVAVQDNQWGGALLKYRTAAEYKADGPPKWDWQDVIHTRPTNGQEKFTKLIDETKEGLKPLLAIMPELEKEADGIREAAQNKLRLRLGWMTRLHPIMTSDKRMMLGLYSDVFNCSLAAFTEDWGKTWTFSEPIMPSQANLLGNIQPSFVKKQNGDIMAFMRDNGLPHYIRTATSKDSGQTWSDLGKLTIANPGSSIECIALKSGKWVLVCNDTSNGRHILTAYLSEDEGATWPHSRRLEDYPKDGGSFSYPSVIQTADGMIHATYSYSGAGVKGSCIKQVCFNEEWVMTKEAEKAK